MQLLLKVMSSLLWSRKRSVSLSGWGPVWYIFISSFTYVNPLFTPPSTQPLTSIPKVRHSEVENPTLTKSPCPGYFEAVLRLLWQEALQVQSWSHV